MNDIGAQVQMAAQCCHLAEALITQEQNLWKVPHRLIDEARKVNKPKTVSPEDHKPSVRIEF